MNQKERMLAGLPYKPWLDGLEEERTRCKEKIYELNCLHPRDRERIPELLKDLFGRTGEDVWLEPPFHCDYGWNIEVGDHFFANYNLTILDVGKVTIGSYVMIAPNVSLYTAGHPLHPASRDSGYEFRRPHHHRGPRVDRRQCGDPPRRHHRGGRGHRRRQCGEPGRAGWAYWLRGTPAG